MIGGRNWQSTGELAVLGMGHALPGPPVGTDALFDLVSPHAPDLRRRQVGALTRQLAIETRHVSRDFVRRVESPRPGGRNPELAAQALTAALADAGLEAGDLGYLIGHTATPAQLLPANIALVADLIGYPGPHVELRQACTGFANALMIAFGLLAGASARPIGIVGSETGSLFFDPATAAGDPAQRVNLMQMGDGAGAIILGSAGRGRNTLHSAWFGATGLGKAPGLEMREGGSDFPSTTSGPLSFAQDYASIAASGPALFDAAVAAAQAQGLSLHAADWIIPHQTSGRIGAQVAARFSLPVERVFVNADRIGNTGSAAIWIALSMLRAERMVANQTAIVLGAEATKFMHGGFAYSHG